MPELPSGTVTFLLTDVEGSTALWEEAPDAMRIALARHDALFEEAVREHRGMAIRPRGEGDSRFAVFSSAPAAVAASLAIQRALVEEQWSTPRPLTVRIGLHTGEAELRDGDYYGSSVNRCARLRGLAHGGQVLLSEATTGLVRDELPGAASLVDLGEHCLRDLSRPERVHQLIAPGLPADFPRLASLDTRLNNLPVQPTQLLGRDRDVQAVRRLLLREDVRLVTLTGPGGTGKTRLGLKVAADLLDDLSDGVCFVSLAPIGDPDLVISTVAQALGLREASGRPFRESLPGYLKEKHLLLLLDNFEQLLPAAPLVADLLAACPKLKVLVTSRAVLHLRGEREFVVPALECPDPKIRQTVEAVSRYPSVALFVQRAAEVKAGFSVTDENASAVAEICRRVDGLPLGIELAAARVRLLTPQAIVTRLERRLRLLTGGARDLPDRQRTLQDTIAWSYDLLDEADRRLFRLLSVFEDDFTLRAAETVAGPEGDHGRSVLNGLGALIGQSLVQPREGAYSEPRFGMLETIRAYGLERLAEHGGVDAARRRHADFYLRLAEAAEPELWGSDQGPWADRLEREHENMRSALRWALDRKETAIALRLTGALARFWAVRGHLVDGQRWLSAALELKADGQDVARAKALNGAGALARDQGSYAAAIRRHREALELWRRAGNSAGVAISFHNRGLAERDAGDRVAARAHLEQSLRIFRELDDQGRTGLALLNLARLAHDDGDEDLSERLLNESLDLFIRVGNTQGIATSLNRLGDLARARGEYDSARDLHQRSLALHRERGDAWGIAISLNCLARVALAEADVERAESLSSESLALLRDVGARPDVAVATESLAFAAQLRADPIRAVRLISSAARLRATLGTQASAADRADLERTLADLRSQLGSARYDAAWAVGQTMSADEAAEYSPESSAAIPRVAKPVRQAAYAWYPRRDSNPQPSA
jgi:predicted ATPase/class 3 adenylate cyclase